MSSEFTAGAKDLQSVKPKDLSHPEAIRKKKKREKYR
jgi:hypothetical protein